MRSFTLKFDTRPNCQSQNGVQDSSTLGLSDPSKRVGLFPSADYHRRLQLGVQACPSDGWPGGAVRVCIARPVFLAARLAVCFISRGPGGGRPVQGPAAARRTKSRHVAAEPSAGGSCPAGL